MDGIPNHVMLKQYSHDATFSDNHVREIPYNGETAMDVYLQLMNSTPGWIDALMRLRNRIASLLGLKHLGNFDDFSPAKKDFNVGDRVGIFTMIYRSPVEVIMEDRDKHLDVKVSFHITPNGNRATVTASTVVHVKNRLGKVYMFFVGPAHKLIVPATLNKLPKI
ncbi:hypothetical protein A1OW_01585 [Enterovibrio norvegicus]|uniref:DUF2867 domain-containing protein n=1 Tax=Enterovibrio norvegicus TaxID=188144 RepID=A0ABV4L207_9GAMM|nr:DUF2867 domain-containing protein [Enterovibrio norvegicus]OEF49790.1 hypothetical protein A1OW_01585 [Enterovibrio norvegicus]OEF60216.1 hypothetical protein A1OU_03215 [Enterovibrio norvegicus]PMI27684.1 hypothetical protein BCU47_22055 [Enterovibrio norvegicus]TKF18823.1 DUF2867 domain-containing protein [Enterovibrio norvegicus]TKF31395.1 DUF2867 domain-containing protein [Enterovibrio norvegicus]